MPPRISQKELAQALGLSQSTVSRALANNIRIPQQTRNLVQQEAARLGYRPDPVLASLNIYRRTRQPISQGQSLAWLGTSRYQPPPPVWVYELALFRAAQKRAEQLGYSLNYFWRNEPDFSLNRLGKILQARGGAGIIFGPQAHAHTRIRLNIDNLAAVGIGRSLLSPAVDIVSTDHFQAMEMCYRKLHKAGYRRIGLALTRSFNERVAGIWFGAYLMQQVRWRGTVAIPAFIGRDDQDASFTDWLATWRPDAIITMGWELGCLSQLKTMGIRAPADIGLALLAVPANVPGLSHHSGISEPLDSLACLAIDVLVGRIRNNDTGVPLERRVHLLPSKWHGGETTRNTESAQLAS